MQLTAKRTKIVSTQISKLTNLARITRTKLPSDTNAQFTFSLMQLEVVSLIQLKSFSLMELKIFLSHNLNFFLSHNLKFNLIKFNS